MVGRTHRLIALIVAVATVGLAGGAISVVQSAAAPPGNDAFLRTWARTDRPVADNRAPRTWMWGPEAFTAPLDEEYADSPGGSRQVQYFDKSRMEITDPNADGNATWYVTNGLLSKELITGRVQLGDTLFEDRPPAQINVAGDPDDPTGPTYATFTALLDAEPYADGALITKRVDRAGNVIDNPALAGQNVTAAFRLQVPGLDHQVASPFWTFMNSSGLVYEDGAFVTDQLFENPFFATGYPITEAYWARVKVAGVYTDVLMQCFERRCLTWTPGNPEGWQVEAGNVGRHYHAWRHNPTPDDGEVLYESSLLDWGAGDHPFGSTFVEDGAYHVRVETAESAIDKATSQYDYGDVSAQLDLRMVAGSSDSAGCLVFRLDFDSFNYSLCIDGDGRTYALYQGYQYGTPISETLLPPANLPGTNRPEEWNALKIIGRGNQFWFFANGALLGTAIHDGSLSGAVGLAAANRGTGQTEFAFRNLTIRAVGLTTSLDQPTPTGSDQRVCHCWLTSE